MDALKLYGQFRVWSGVIVLTCVAISCCTAGGYIWTHPEKRTSKTTGTVSSVNCFQQKDGPQCSGNVAYSVDSKPYTIRATWNKTITNGMMVDVYYDPKNPSQGTVNPVPKALGPGLISGGACLVLCAVVIGMVFSSLGNQGKAVVGGAAAASDAYSIFSRN